MKNKRNDATGHVKDDYLNDLFEKNFLKIDKDLDKYGVPQEIVYPISIREDCNLIKSTRTALYSVTIGLIGFSFTMLDAINQVVYIG